MLQKPKKVTEKVESILYDVRKIVTEDQENADYDREEYYHYIEEHRWHMKIQADNTYKVAYLFKEELLDYLDRMNYIYGTRYQ